MPSQHSCFTNNEFHAAVQNAVGTPLSLLNQAIGLPIKSTTNGPTPKAPDDEGAFKYENYHSLDHTH
jgi:hypothetical protein